MWLFNHSNLPPRNIIGQYADRLSNNRSRYYLQGATKLQIAGKRPSHTTTETSLSSIHTTTFLHNCNNFLNSFIFWATIFTKIFWVKSW